MLVVAIKSCVRDRDLGFHEAIRATWGADLKTRGISTMFFMGHSGGAYFQKHPGSSAANLKSDEVMVDSADDYLALPFKTRGICQYLLSKNVDNVFLADNDTFINAEKLLSFPFQRFDLAGYFSNRTPGEQFHYKDHMGEYPNCYAWCSGGIGYFLSRNAIFAVADSFPKVWAEDMFTAQVVGPDIQKGQMVAAHFDLVKMGASDHFRKSKKFPQFTPELVYRAHRDGGFQQIYAEASQ